MTKKWRAATAVPQRVLFPLMGTKESVSALSPVVIRRWQRLLFQPQNACLCISGNFSAAMESTAAENLW